MFVFEVLASIQSHVYVIAPCAYQHFEDREPSKCIYVYYTKFLTSKRTDFVIIIKSICKTKLRAIIATFF
jgi:hypothetical protein